MISFRRAVQVASLLFVLIAAARFVKSQAIGDTVAPLQERQVQPNAVTAYQLQKYLMRQIPKPAAPATAEQWNVEAQKLRKHILDDVAYHGWPQEWIGSTPRFEQTEVIETSHGYRVRKYRYEIVPGFESTAILYEPEQLSGRVPAILNLTGHEPLGNLTEYEQKRCINFAKRGILALSLGWPGLGELGQPENNHDFAGQLDLVGSNALGFFYLIVRRGLDFLTTLPNTDAKRIGVTGLSGGGWQTIMISALDKRVNVMVEVAGWYENIDPGTHNYQLDNRQQAYAFFSEHFHLASITKEIPSDSELFTPLQLAGSLPKGNLTTLGLARKLASQIHRDAIPAVGERDAWAKSQREQLKSIIRYSPVSVDSAWKLASEKPPGLQSISYRFDFSNSLSATGIWVARRAAAADAPLTILLNDKGYKASARHVAERVNRGEQVLAFEPIFFGSTSPDETEPAYWEMLVASRGDRAIGLEVGQLIAAAKSFRSSTDLNNLCLITDGIRSQVVALVAAALEPDLFSVIESNNAMTSLSYLLDAPIPYRTAPDLFCLDLYKHFDIDRMTMLAYPAKATILSKIVFLPASVSN
jgi:hypothetical protein